MAGEQRQPQPEPNGTPELDELQRGQEAALTVETMERVAPPTYGQTREVPIPEPGERPGAVRVDHPADAGGTSHAG